MNYEKLIAHRNHQNPFLKYVGITITDIADGYAKAVLPVCANHLNPLGYVHGGCLYTLADTVAGSAASSYGKQAVTVTGNIQYLYPAKDTRSLHAVAKACKHAKTIAVFDVEIFSDAEALLAKGLFTFYLLDKDIAF